MIGVLRGNSRADIRIQLDLASGLYLTRQDAINSGVTWRLANPNAIFTSRDSQNAVDI